MQGLQQSRADRLQLPRPCFHRGNWCLLAIAAISCRGRETSDLRVPRAHEHRRTTHYDSLVRFLLLCRQLLPIPSTGLLHQGLVRPPLLPAVGRLRPPRDLHLCLPVVLLAQVESAVRYTTRWELASGGGTLATGRQGRGHTAQAAAKCPGAQNGGPNTPACTAPTSSWLMALARSRANARTNFQPMPPRG